MQENKDIVVYNNIAFNAVWANSKTEAEFVAHEKHHEITEDQLREVHKLCKAAQAPQEKAPAKQKVEPVK